MAALTTVAPVAAIPGNHDAWPGVAAVRAAVATAGGRWPPDDPLAAPVRIDRVLIAGPRVLCTHAPRVFPAAAAAGYELVLAGHLHGGQCVLADRDGRQYPAAWLHRWHGLRFTHRDAAMLVSRGVADTFPVRVNCPREVVLAAVE